MRNVIITGATRGIGFAIAKRLDQRGWHIFSVNEDPERTQTITTSLSNLAGYVSVDLGSGESAALEVATSVRKTFSQIDLLVLNAGIFIEERLSELNPQTFERNMQVNLNANMFLVKHLLPLLRRGTKPRIVIIGSTAAYEPYPLVPTYGVAKWALRGFAYNLRHELIPERIGVTFFSPGGTLTDMWAGEELPPNRLLQPNDIAILVDALTELSEQAVIDELIIRPMLGDIHE
jgi:NAD(P)-dependent dehydrogenase (short-subunit alcohol dehydrogenase family)